METLETLSRGMIEKTNLHKSCNFQSICFTPGKLQKQIREMLKYAIM